MRPVEHHIQWDKEKVSRIWDYYSRTVPYSELYFSKLFGHKILRKTRLSLDSSLSVLDFGCGPGFLWEHVKRLGAKWKYTGLDFSAESVKKLTEKASGDIQFGGAVHATRLPTHLAEGTFNAILLCEVVEHLNDEELEKTLVECRRLLASGGTLIVTTPNDEDLSRAMKFCPECCSVFHEWQHVRTWRQDTLETYMAQHGFKQSFSDVTDFSAQGIIGIAKHVKGILTGKVFKPHMIAGFTKG